MKDTLDGDLVDADGPRDEEVKGLIAANSMLAKLGVYYQSRLRSHAAFLKTFRVDVDVDDFHANQITIEDLGHNLVSQNCDPYALKSSETVEAPDGLLEEFENAEPMYPRGMPWVSSTHGMLKL